MPFFWSVKKLPRNNDANLSGASPPADVRAEDVEASLKVSGTEHKQTSAGQALRQGSGQAQFLVQDVFFIEGRGIIVAGRLESGTLRKGMGAAIRGKSARVESIESFHRNMGEVSADDGKPKAIGILLNGIAKGDVGRGDILAFRE